MTQPRILAGYRLAALTAVLVPSITALVSAGRWGTRNPVTFAESRLDPAMLAFLLLASALVPVAVFAARPRTACALGLAIASVGSQVPFWAAWPGLPDGLRSAALAVTPLTVAGVAAAVHGWAPRPVSWVLRASFVAVALAVAVHLLGYDPFGDPGCVRTCGNVTAPLEFALSAKDAVAIAAALTVVAAGLAAVGVLRSGAPAAADRRWTGSPRSALSLDADPLGVVGRRGYSQLVDLAGAGGSWTCGRCHVHRGIPHRAISACSLPPCPLFVLARTVLASRICRTWFRSLGRRRGP